VKERAPREKKKREMKEDGEGGENSEGGEFSVSIWREQATIVVNGRYFWVRGEERRSTGGRTEMQKNPTTKKGGEDWLKDSR